MVRGLDRFASHFTGYEDQYVLIGGMALILSMEEAGLQARATKDLDIVLCLEVLEPTFVNAFWKFIELGAYEKRERGDGKRVFYRFQKPQNSAFPQMIELFSRKPNALTLAEGQYLTPIPAGGEAESLSAILLDADYYAFLHERKGIVQSIPVVDTLGLIALKAHAWLQLSEQKRNGGKVDSKNIDKHRNDVFRLYQIVDPAKRVGAPMQVRRDMGLFLDALDPKLDLKPYGLIGIEVTEVVRVLKVVFNIVTDAVRSV
jgi:hypothetical protein